MKTLISLIIFLHITFECPGQYIEYDTLRKHEVSCNVIPAIMLLAGDIDPRTSNFSVGYRHYFKNRYVLRSAVVIFPQANFDFYSGMPQYDRTIGNRNVFVNYWTGGGMKTQLNIGLEKIFKVNRLMHGFGCDIFFNHKYAHRGEDYFYRPDSVSAGKFSTFDDTTNYMVDSLGFASYSQHLGFGLQVFYSLRYRISKHWYISTTIGPSFNLAFVSGTYYERRNKTERNQKSTSFDFPNIPLISDISVCFRF